MNISMRIAFGALLFATACGAPAWADVAPQPGTPTVITAGANDASGDAGVVVGEHLLVKLPVAGGTGFSWKLSDEAGPELSLAGQRVERTAPRLGAPQVSVFDFEARVAGQKSLTFDLVGPGASEPSKTYTLTVTINE